MWLLGHLVDIPVLRECDQQCAGKVWPWCIQLKSLWLTDTLTIIAFKRILDASPTSQTNWAQSRSLELPTKFEAVAQSGLHCHRDNGAGDWSCWPLCSEKLLFKDCVPEEAVLQLTHFIRLCVLPDPWLGCVTWQQHGTCCECQSSDSHWRWPGWTRTTTDHLGLPSYGLCSVYVYGRGCFGCWLHLFPHGVLAQQEVFCTRLL